jgi:hypothetical protein
MDLSQLRKIITYDHWCLFKRQGMILYLAHIKCLETLKYIQGDQKVSVHLMITIQKVTSNVQNVPRQSPDIY